MLLLSAFARLRFDVHAASTARSRIDVTDIFERWEPQAALETFRSSGTLER